MKQKIAIVDYGRGNLRSVEKALIYLNYGAFITSDPKELKKADKIVLPGVGAFGDAINELTKNNLIEPLKEMILEKKKPFLGICLGFQLLFEGSEESPGVKGLSLIKGKVVKFKISQKVPHMGWNQIYIKKDTPLYKEISSGSFVYFVHSFYAICNDKNDIATITDYEIDFTSSVVKDNIMATQFHPEKSQKVGLQILKNFGEL